FFEQMWRRLTGTILGLRSSARAVPDVPFIKREPQLLLGSLVPTDQVADCKGFRYLPVHSQVHGNEFFAAAASLLFGISKVAVQRHPINVVVTLLQHLAVRFKIGGHKRSAGSARNQP